MPLTNTASGDADVRCAAYPRRMATPEPVDATPEPAIESCPRCAAAMEWRHGTFQCPRCRFKVGCCEGLTGDCRT